MIHCGTKEIKTKRLTLRQFTIDDTLKMFENWAADEDVTKYLTWNTHQNIEVTKGVINEWIASYTNLDFYQWIVTYNNEPIGSISLMDINDVLETASVGYCYSKKYRNQGFATEALAAIIDYCFNELMLKRVAARYDEDNIYSGKVMVKCGMKFLSKGSECVKNRERTIITNYIDKTM